MKLYQERLNEYKRAEKELQKQIEYKKIEREKISNDISALEQSLSDEKEKLSDYVKNEIVLKNYQVGKVKLEDGKIIYYPILEMPDGFKLVEEEIKYLKNYDVEYGIYLDRIQHKYIIEHEIMGLRILVFADSEANLLGYINKDICFWIKENFAMAYSVNYKVTINSKEFELKRNFNDNIIQKVLQEMLKDKYICYNDFDEESNKKCSKRRHCLNNHLNPYRKGIVFSHWRFRECRNRSMHLHGRWEELLKGFLKRSKKAGDIEKVIQDINEQLKEDIDRNRKLYPLDEDCSLVVDLFNDSFYNKYCIAYEDEELILEIPPQIKHIELEVAIVKKEYDENWNSFINDYLKEENIVKKDIFYIFINELDMNKRMPILDIIEKFKN